MYHELPHRLRPLDDLPLTQAIADDILNSTPTDEETGAAEEEVNAAIMALETQLRSAEMT